MIRNVSFSCHKNLKVVYLFLFHVPVKNRKGNEKRKNFPLCHTLTAYAHKNRKIEKNNY